MCKDSLAKLRSRFTHPKEAYLALLGGFLVQLTLGGVYTYGNMAPYMIGYMKNFTKPENINVGNSMWIFGLCIFGLGASMSFGGFIEPKIGTPLTVLLGSLMMSFGVFVTFWTIQVHLALIALSYGLLVGLGVGLAYGVILSVPSEWFPESKGLVTGIVVGGFGLGAVIFDLPQSYYINGDITTTTVSNPEKVRYSFLYMSLICSIIQLIGTFMIRKPQNQETANRMLDVTGFNDAIVEDLKYRDANLKTYQLIFERDFWILWLTYTFNSVVIIMVLSLHKTFGNTIINNDLVLTMASAIGALCNGLGRIVWGFFNDKIPYKVLMSILSLCMTLMLSTFYLCTMVRSNGVIVMYFAWVLILHFLLSGNFSLFPIVCAKTFGMQNFAGNYGLLFTGYSFAGVLTSVLTTKLLEKGESSASYLAPFLVGSGFSLISSLLTLFYRGKSLMHKGEMFSF